MERNGQFLWKYYYSLGWSALISSLRFDSENNIILTGESYTSMADIVGDGFYERESVLTVLKISPDGEILWDYSRTDNPENRNLGRLVTIDNEDKVYVNGILDVGQPAQKKVIIKLDRNGVEKWSHSYEGSSSIDTEGNIYIIGILDVEQPNQEKTIIKLDKNGLEKWNQSFDYTNFKNITHYDNTVSVIACLSDDQCSLLKYDKGGSLLLNNNLTPKGAFGSFRFDAEGNIYAIYDNSYTLSKYNSEGKFLWNFDVPAADSNLTLKDYISVVSIDQQMNVYLTGRYWSNSTNSDALIYKLGKNGNEIWSEIIELPSRPSINPLANGKALLTEKRNPEEGNREGITRYIDSNGQELWSLNSEFDREYEAHLKDDDILYTFRWFRDDDFNSKLLINGYDQITGITNSDIENNLILYPNPSSELVNISFPNNTNASFTISIVNSSSRIIDKIELNNSEKQISYDTTLLSAGVYTVRVTSKSGSYISKLIIQ